MERPGKSSSSFHHRSGDDHLPVHLRRARGAPRHLSFVSAIAACCSCCIRGEGNHPSKSFAPRFIHFFPLKSLEMVEVIKRKCVRSMSCT